MLIQCPRLTPIQTRLVASLLALGALALVYWALAHTQFAYAAELDSSEEAASREGSDHNWHRLEEDISAADHSSSDRLAHQATLVSRADTHTIDANNSPNRGNLTAGQTNVWRYTLQLLQSPSANQSLTLPSGLNVGSNPGGLRHAELRKREAESEDFVKRQASTRTIFISINTCSQPTWNGTDKQDIPPPQLVMYIGRPGAQNVGPDSASTSQYALELDEGFADYFMDTSSEVYIAVSAPTSPSNFSGGWTYDLAVSIDGYYHASKTSVPFLYLVDTDGTSTLLVTDDLTHENASSSVYQNWLSLSSPLPFTMFANAETEPRAGLRRSYCGLKNVAQITSLRNTTGSEPSITTSMVTRGIKNKPKQQFIVDNLNPSTHYNASLALVGNGVNSGKGVVGGGGTVWQSMGWTTKTDGNCQLIYDMQFCDDVAYAVPSNPKYNSSSLESIYDNYASQLYQAFNYSLMQIQCNTTNDQRYSLARNCDDCATAYKRWLCAVTIPRCEDFSSTASFLQPRNVNQPFLNNSMLSDEILMTEFQPMSGAPALPGSPIMQTYASANATNQSRNPLIDQQIAPGPYKEVLPCEDLCYNLVQSCPAALQFACPYPGRGLEVGYAPRPRSKSVVECNFPGVVHYIDDARRVIPSISTILAVAIIGMSIMYI